MAVAFPVTTTTSQMYSLSSTLLWELEYESTTTSSLVGKVSADNATVMKREISSSTVDDFDEERQSLPHSH
jgi:hypothetical protein